MTRTWAHKAGERLRAMRSDEGAVDAVIALLHWLRGDRVEQPWRLTRRQRVEMEAALASLRLDVRFGFDVEEVIRAALVLGGTLTWHHPDVSGLRAWLLLRARVAIALRAALRADEDARCEEVYVSLWKTGRLGYYQQTEAYNGGLWDAMQALREWMPVGHGSQPTPLALWERA